MKFWKSTLAGLVVAACSSPTIPHGDATIAGAIYARNTATPTSNGRPTVHVKTSGADACGIIFAVTDDTDLVRQTGGRVVEAQLSDFRLGMKVRAWTDGGVMESCPAQAFATAIELID